MFIINLIPCIKRALQSLEKWELNLARIILISNARGVNRSTARGTVLTVTRFKMVSCEKIIL